MGFQGVCREIVRMRRAKLVCYVRDAFIQVFRPPLILTGDEDDPSVHVLMAEYNKAVRTPISRKRDSTSNGDALELRPCTIEAMCNAPRFAIDGQSTDWTDSQLYLQFLCEVQLRVPGMPIEVHDTLNPPRKVTVASRFVEEWIQMTVSSIVMSYIACVLMFVSRPGGQVLYPRTLPFS